MGFCATGFLPLGDETFAEIYGHSQKTFLENPGEIGLNP